MAGITSFVYQLNVETLFSENKFCETTNDFPRGRHLQFGDAKHHHILSKVALIVKHSHCCKLYENLFRNLRTP